MSWGHLQLGRAPKKDSAKHLMLARYFTADLPKVPDVWDGYRGGAASPVMGGNDKYGDCTIVALVNHIRLLAAADGVALPNFTDQEIIEFYFARSGGVDSGLCETDVIDYVLRNGFPSDGRYKFVGRATVDHTDWNAMQTAAYLFGGLYLGVSLPLRAQNEGQHWSVQGDGATGDDEPGSWGGHAIVLSGYDQVPSPWDKPELQIGNASILTWGSVVYVTKHWLETYGDEAHVLLDERHLSMPGIDGDALRADLAALNKE